MPKLNPSSIQECPDMPNQEDDFLLDLGLRISVVVIVAYNNESKAETTVE